MSNSNTFALALRFSGGGAQYIDPIKEPRPHDARSRTPGPPPPPEPPNWRSRWGRKIFYGAFTVIVIGGTIWIFSARGGGRPLTLDQMAATAEAERTATAQAQSPD